MECNGKSDEQDLFARFEVECPNILPITILRFCFNLQEPMFVWKLSLKLGFMTERVGGHFSVFPNFRLLFHLVTENFFLIWLLYV